MALPRSQTVSRKLAVALACGSLGALAAVSAGGCGEDRGASGTGTGKTGTGTGTGQTSPSTTPTTESTPTTTTE
jgi:hypothetical protein